MFESDDLTYRAAKFLICFFLPNAPDIIAKNILAATERKCDICVIYSFFKHKISIVFVYAAFDISKRFKSRLISSAETRNSVETFPSRF